MSGNPGSPGRQAEASSRCRRPLQHRDHLARRAAARRRRRAARRAHAARQGSDRHRRDPHDLRLADLRRPRADAHATVVQRALDAGAVVVGKANLPEFAWGVLGVNPWYGAVHNPLHPGKTTGGSSAGNAAALAAGLVDLGLGTDTGCSIRLPSAACGTVGLKPRWGHLPLDGVFPLVPTLDTVGPMGRSVEDVALLWSVLVGPRRAGAPARGADGRAPAARARDRRRAGDRVERRGRRLGGGSRAARRARRRVRGARCPRRHVAALPPRGRREPPRHVPLARRGVRRR